MSQVENRSLLSRLAPATIPIVLNVRSCSHIAHGRIICVQMITVQDIFTTAAILPCFECVDRFLDDLFSVTSVTDAGHIHLFPNHQCLAYSQTMQMCQRRIRELQWQPDTIWCHITLEWGVGQTRMVRILTRRLLAVAATICFRWLEYQSNSHI